MAIDISEKGKVLDLNVGKIIGYVNGDFSSINGDNRVGLVVSVSKLMPYLYPSIKEKDVN